MNIDNQLTTAIYTLPHNPLLDGFFNFFSATGIFELCWILLFVLVVYIEGARHHRFIFSFFISTITSAILTNIILKNLFMRARPLALHPPLQYLTDYSFPSGHATFAFSAAYILAQYNKKRAPYFYVIATLVAFSRVYLGYHFVTDVIVGSIIGVTVSWLTLYIIDKKYA